MRQIPWAIFAACVALVTLLTAPAVAHERGHDACDHAEHADDAHGDHRDCHTAAEPGRAGEPHGGDAPCGCADDHTHCSCGCDDCDGPGCGDCGCSHGIAGWALPADGIRGRPRATPDSIAAIDAARPPTAPQGRLLQPPRPIFEG